MSCTTEFWLYSLGSLLLGGLVIWAFMNNKLTDLRKLIKTKDDKIISIGNDYSSLRSSSQEQILSLKEEQSSITLMPKSSSDKDMKYEKLKVEYNNMQSQMHELKRNGKGTGEKNNLVNSKLIKKIELLSRENETLKKQVKPTIKDKGGYRKSIKGLRKEVKALKTELKKRKDSSSTIEKRVEIIKSLRTKKLKDWLNREKSYKVKRKVSRSKMKGKS
ncbi:MAG: hypothetical protein V3V00_01325 [Saprospiraceae bacterium]